MLRILEPLSPTFKEVWDLVEWLSLRPRCLVAVLARRGQSTGYQKDSVQMPEPCQTQGHIQLLSSVCINQRTVYSVSFG